MTGRGRAAPRKLSEAEFVGQIAQAGDIRLFLIFGQDESAISDMAGQMCKRLGEDAERVDIESEQLRKDPALLADEAGSISLFGGSRYIRLTIRREDSLPAIENLLGAPQAGNPVIATAGDLKKNSKLRKLAEGHPLALTYICFPPKAADLAAQIQTAARDAGLRLDRNLALQICGATGNDRRLALMEVEKLALYYDSKDAGQPIEIQADAVQALSAETDEENSQALVNRVLGGDMKALGSELASARQIGLSAIPLLRAFQRRIALLMGLQSKLANGERMDQLLRSPMIFWMERDAIAAQLRRWPARRLSGLNAHILKLEKQLMQVRGGLDQTLLEEELTRIARAAARQS